MRKIENFLEKFLMPFASLISNNLVINSIKDGMMQILPLLLVGSIILVITNFPYIEVIFPTVDLWAIFGKGFEATMGIAALIASFTIAFNYAERLKSNGVYGAITSVVSYLVLTDFFVTANGEVVGGVISVSAFGSRSLFTVIFVALISVRIYAWFESKKWTIKMPDQVPANVSSSFSSILPLTFVVLIMLALRAGFAATDFGNIQNFIFEAVTFPLMGLANFKYFIVVMNMLTMVFWFFGLHGGMMVQAIFGPVLNSMTIANAEAFAANLELPYITSYVFNNSYGTLAAAGVLAAIVAAIIVGKSKTTKSVTKISLIPAIFGIQEPFHFGFPTFMNPIMLIPYILVPGVTSFIGYTLIELNIAPQPVIDVPWTTPILIQGFISTNFNVMGAIVQLILFALSVAMYIPFIRIADRMNLRKEETETES